MKLKFISLATVLVLILCFASCGKEEVQGGDSNGFEFTSNNDGTCCVSGYDHSSLSTKVEIPSVSPDGDTVVSIGDDAFLNCKSISKIIIPETVVSLASYCFRGCDSLKSISIPASVTDISNKAFMYSYSLAEIKVAEGNPSYKDIDGNLYSKDGTELIQYAIGKQDSCFEVPNGVIAVGEFAFVDCDFLESVTIAKSTTAAFAPAFSECDALAEIGVAAGNSIYESIDGNLYTLDGYALVCYAPGKTDSSFEIPEGINVIDESAFCGNGALESVTIPASVTEIRRSAFRSCYNMTDVRFAENSQLEIIGENAFSGCSDLKIIMIPESVVTICSDAFNSCGLKRIIFAGSELKTIESGVFADCIYLTEISIPEGVTKICESAFMDCKSLGEVRISSSVSEISSGAFFGCDSLIDVYYTGSEAEWAAINTGAGNECLAEANIHYNYAE